MVGFDQGAIDAFLAANTLTTATLVLTTAENANNWGTSNDRTVDAHPLTVDAEIANQATDCDPTWNGGTFGPATAAPVVHVNGLSGAVSWDVTLDVEAGGSRAPTTTGAAPGTRATCGASLIWTNSGQRI